MSGRLVAWIVFVGFLFLAGSPARASEAPARGVSVELPALTAHEAAAIRGSFDLATYRKTRNTWRIGMALGALAPVVAFGGAFLGLGICFYDCDTGIAIAVATLPAMGMAVAGMALTIKGGLGHVGVLRRGGLHVSNALAFSSLIVPLALATVAVPIGLLGRAGEAVLISSIAYVGIFALSGAQLAHDASKVGRMPMSLAVVPTWNGRSAGAAVSARW